MIEQAGGWKVWIPPNLDYMQQEGKHVGRELWVLSLYKGYNFTKVEMGDEVECCEMRMFASDG